MEHRIIRGFVGAIVRFTGIMNAAATTWTFLLMFFMTADVFGRIFLNHPLTGAPELVRVSLVGVVYLHMPYTLWSGKHIRSDLLSSRMGPKAAAMMNVVTHFLGAALFAAIFFSSWGQMIDAWQSGAYEGEGALRVPTAPIRTILVVGTAMTMVLYAVRLIEGFLTLIPGTRKAPQWIRSS
ncbi:MAG: TRAP transporter small permease [Thermodesulfobacteriota bacterium]